MINSKDNANYKLWMKLQQKKYRQSERKFLVEGVHLVVEAKQAGILVEVIVAEGVDFAIDAPLTILRKDLFERLAGTVNSAGVMAVCQMHEAELTSQERVLLVDGIQDPGNLGTLIRSALAFGFDGIVMSPDTVDIYNEKVVRATQGALFALPILRRDLADYVATLQSDGVTVYATTLTARARPLTDVKATHGSTGDKLAFVVGNEGSGVRESLVGVCDGTVVIEMALAVESLNVGVAGSILMYEFRKID